MIYTTSQQRPDFDYYILNSSEIASFDDMLILSFFLFRNTYCVCCISHLEVRKECLWHATWQYQHLKHQIILDQLKATPC